MEYERTLVVRKAAIIALAAICVTGVGAAAIIVGGPLTGTTHLNQADIEMAWWESDVLYDERWARHDHTHVKLYVDPPGEGFLANIWGGVHYAIDFSALYPDTGISSQPTLSNVQIILMIDGRAVEGLTLSDFTVAKYTTDTGGVWTDVSLSSVDGNLVGLIQVQTFAPGDSVDFPLLGHPSLEVTVSTLAAEQDVVFTMYAWAP